MRTAIMVLPLLVLAACGESSDDKQSLAFVNLACPATSFNASLMEADTRVITSTEQLTALMHEIDNHQQEDLPPVDFANRQVVAIYGGFKSSGGHEITVTQVTESASDITIHYEQQAPGKNCMATTVITYPYCLIELEKTTKPIVFAAHTNDREC